MNKSEFIKAFAEQAGLSQKAAAKAYDAFVNVVTDSLKKGDKVQLTGFVNIEVKSKPAREGINPRTKETIKIAASKAPVAKFGKAYKELFN